MRVPQGTVATGRERLCKYCGWNWERRSRHDPERGVYEFARGAGADTGRAGRNRRKSAEKGKGFTEKAAGLWRLRPGAGGLLYGLCAAGEPVHPLCPGLRDRAGAAGAGQGGGVVAQPERRGRERLRPAHRPDPDGKWRHRHRRIRHCGHEAAQHLLHPGLPPVSAAGGQWKCPPAGRRGGLEQQQRLLWPHPTGSCGLCGWTSSSGTSRRRWISS